MENSGFREAVRWVWEPNRRRASAVPGAVSRTTRSRTSKSIPSAEPAVSRSTPAVTSVPVPVAKPPSFGFRSPLLPAAVLGQRLAGRHEGRRHAPESPVLVQQGPGLLDLVPAQARRGDLAVDRPDENGAGVTRRIVPGTAAVRLSAAGEVFVQGPRAHVADRPELLAGPVTGFDGSFDVCQLDRLSGDYCAGTAPCRLAAISCARQSRKAPYLLEFRDFRTSLSCSLSGYSC